MSTPRCGVFRRARRDNETVTLKPPRPLCPAWAASGSSSPLPWPCSGRSATRSSTSPPRRPARAIVHVTGSTIRPGDFGGVPQEGDRLGSADAPVSIQVFADLQCGSCREDFLYMIPPLADSYARPGKVELRRAITRWRKTRSSRLLRRRGRRRQGYGWQYTYLFFRNQAEAERFDVDQGFRWRRWPARSANRCPEWEKDLETEECGKEATTKTLEGYDELATGLGIRTRPAEDRQRPLGHPHPSGRPDPRRNRTSDSRSRLVRLPLGDISGGGCSPPMPKIHVTGLSLYAMHAEPTPSRRRSRFGSGSRGARI